MKISNNRKPKLFDFFPTTSVTQWFALGALDEVVPVSRCETTFLISSDLGVLG